MPTRPWGFLMSEHTDRCRGALVGLAVGDALGAAVEFKSPGEFEPVTGYRSGGPHRLNPGEWTDDTSMALALADSIAAVGWDINDQARRYVEWSESGKYSVNGRCFDIGITTSRSLSKFRQTNDAFSSGNTSDSSSGNGSIMRLAPVAIHCHKMFPDDIASLSRMAEQSSLPTHASEQCLSSCRYMAADTFRPGPRRRARQGSFAALGIPRKVEGGQASPSTRARDRRRQFQEEAAS